MSLNSNQESNFSLKYNFYVPNSLDDKDPKAFLEKLNFTHLRFKNPINYFQLFSGRDRDRGGRGGDRRDGGGRDRPVWLDKYGPPTRTDFRVIVENLSSRVSWQVMFLIKNLLLI